MRTLRHVSSAGLAAAMALASPQAAPASAGAPICRPAQSTFGFVQLLCGIDANASPMMLRFHADFTGVHDDSSARLTPRLDGAPVACDAASQLHLQGEAQGERLSCGFTLPPSDRSRELRLYLEWHHAEPAGYGWKLGRPGPVAPAAGAAGRDAVKR